MSSRTKYLIGVALGLASGLILGTVQVWDAITQFVRVLSASSQPS